MRTLTAMLLLMTSAAAAKADIPPATSTRVAVYQPVGSRQCSGGGVGLATMQKRLADAKVRVFGFACGSDGQMRTQVCDAPDGAIRIFDISASQLAAAVRAGFRPLSELPDAVREPCR